MLAPYADDLRFLRARGGVPRRVWVLWALERRRPRQVVFAPHVVVLPAQFRPGRYDWSDLDGLPVTVLVGTRSADRALWALVAELASVAAPVDVVLRAEDDVDRALTGGDQVMVLDAASALAGLRIDQGLRWPPGWSAEAEAEYLARCDAEPLAVAA